MLYQKNLATLLTLTHLAEKWPHRWVKTRSAKNFIRNAMKTKALLQMIQDGDVEPTLRLLNLQLHRQLCCRLERFSKYIKENFF
jgi:hypothetical protein